MSDILERFKAKATMAVFDEKQNNFTDNRVFKFNFKEKGIHTLRVRLLPRPDVNGNAVDPWLEVKFHSVFDDNKPKFESICLNNWKERCPICEHTSLAYKQYPKVDNKSTTPDHIKAFGAKTECYANVLIKEYSFLPDGKDKITVDTHEACNTVKLIKFGAKLQNLVKNQMNPATADSDLETECVWDLDGGVDIIIKYDCRKNTALKDIYELSKLSNKVTPLANSREEMANILSQIHKIEVPEDYLSNKYKRMSYDELLNFYATSGAVIQEVDFPALKNVYITEPPKSQANRDFDQVSEYSNRETSFPDGDVEIFNSSNNTTVNFDDEEDDIPF